MEILKLLYRFFSISNHIKNFGEPYKNKPFFKNIYQKNLSIRESVKNHFTNTLSEIKSIKIPSPKYFLIQNSYLEIPLIKALITMIWILYEISVFFPLIIFLSQIGLYPEIEIRHWITKSYIYSMSILSLIYHIGRYTFLKHLLQNRFQKMLFYTNF